ncbi:SGK494 [Mytilus coruscus]|uniref:SGK494 n=1 Tax=Mytilus coruscus TaxID=42192 RepID=A0A6J8A3X3_MYTCO|nr:SGK494 [Mytilus coruscus]
MGNSNQKNPLRKAQSVPESQFLQETNPDFVRSKTRASARLSRGKSHEQLENDSSTPDKPKWNNVPLVEALFLPDFPVRGDFKQQEFEVIDVIAKGAYGNVYLVRREDEKQNYAVKVMGKTQIIVENAIQQCKDEAAIQAMLGDHPFIVKLHEYWQSRKFLYIVLDYVPFGDMFTLWTFHGYFPQPLVKIYVSQLALVLDYLHNAGVIYRDLKFLQETNPDFVRSKTRASARLSRGKSHEQLENDSSAPDKPKREGEKQNYAVKVMGKTQIIVENAIQQCKDEAAIQAMLGDHPFIVKLHEYWQSRKFLYIVLDYVPFGDMFTLWTFHGYFPQPLVKIYVSQLALVLGNIQLTDFGLSKWLTKGEKTRTICGTLQYMAPEVLVSHPYGHTADWWSLGILMFVMLAGKYPAEGALDHMEMTKLVWECDYLLPNHCSDSAQEVVSKLLIKSPEKRMTDLSALQNLAFYKGINFTAVIEKKISPKQSVPVDFFPMSGVSFSYAPNTDPSSAYLVNGKDPFAGFDCVWNLPPDAEEAVYV